MSKITVAEVEKLAQLARIGLSEEEKKSLAEQMTEILGFAEELNKIDVSGVEPTSQVTGLKNVFREDKVIVSELSIDEKLANAPAREAGSIKVKKVL